VRRLARGLTRGELLLLVALAGWSLIPTAAALVHLAQDGGSWTGVDGNSVTDHLQYLAWVREASEHVLISNRFDTAHDPAVYAQPMWALSGFVAALTGSVQLGYLLLKPIAVAVLFGGVWAYVRRTVDGPGRRLAALALALFYVSPAAVLVGWGKLGDGDTRFVTDLFAVELSPSYSLWGYFQTAVAVGLMPVFLLAVERVLDPAKRAPGRGPRLYAGAAAAAGLLASWVHPWQGIVLLGILAALFAWGPERGRFAALALPASATLAPIVYFFVLSRTDTAWKAGRLDSELPHHWGWLLAALAPLAVFAIAGALARRPFRDLDLQERALLLWPLVTLLVYAVFTRSFYYHLISGLTIPLAVLAVRSFDPRALVARLAAVVAIAACTLPGHAYLLDSFRDDVNGGGLARYLRGGESAALHYLDDSPRDGAVLARVYLGAAIPAFTGRRTYVGHPSWTPDFYERDRQTDRLFHGRMSPAEARDLIRRSGAAFAVTDCNEPLDLRALAGPLVVGELHFGCATVYELRSGG
jgi:hypothetical protein